MEAIAVSKVYVLLKQLSDGILPLEARQVEPSQSGDESRALQSSLRLPKAGQGQGQGDVTI